MTVFKTFNLMASKYIRTNQALSEIWNIINHYQQISTISDQSSTIIITMLNHHHDEPLLTIISYSRPLSTTSHTLFAIINHHSALLNYTSHVCNHHWLVMIGISPLLLGLSSVRHELTTLLNHYFYPTISWLTIINHHSSSPAPVMHAW